jgi:hypothetical protein
VSNTGPITILSLLTALTVFFAKPLAVNLQVIKKGAEFVSIAK